MSRYKEYDAYDRMWKQGYLISTERIRRWTRSQIVSASEEESKRVFRRFSSYDQGKSRIFIKRFNTVDEAIHKCLRHNQMISRVAKLNRLLLKYSG